MSGEDSNAFAASYNALADNWESSNGDTSTFAREAMRAYATSYCGELCGDVGAWIGEAFGNALEALGGRSNPCEDNPAACVATNEASTVLFVMGYELERAYLEAVAKVTDLLPQRSAGGWSGPDTERAKALLANGKHIGPDGPIFPSGQVTETAERLSARVQSWARLAGQIHFELAAGVLAAAALKTDGGPPRLRAAPRRQSPAGLLQGIVSGRITG